MSSAERSKIIELTIAPARQYKEKKEAQEPTAIPFPTEALPKELAWLIDSLYESNRFNKEFQAGAALAIFSSISGNHFKVKVKEEWIEPLILWIPIVGDPASMKTPALKSYMRPLWRYEKAWQENHKVELQQWQDRQNNGGNVNDDPEPKAKELIVSSATMEAIFKTMNNNRNGLLLFRDELVGWIKSMNQYRGGGDDQEQWLSIYNNEPLKISRATKETAFIERSFVSVLGGIQPAVINELAGSNKDSNGFTYRLSFIFPENQEIPGWVEHEIDHGLIHQYETAIGRIIGYTQSQSPLIYTMSQPAKKLFIKWYEANKRKMMDSGSDMHKAIYKKLEAQCIRISGIVQTMKFAYQNDSPSHFIEEESMKSAISIAEYFRATSLKAHGQIMENDPIIEKAADLYTDGMTVREVATMLRVSKSKVSRWKTSHPKIFKRRNNG